MVNVDRHERLALAGTTADCARAHRGACPLLACVLAHPPLELSIPGALDRVEACLRFVQADAVSGMGSMDEPRRCGTRAWLLVVLLWPGRILPVVG